MPEGSQRVGMAPDAAREWRVDEDGSGPDRGWQKIVDQLGIVTCDSHTWEGGRKHVGAGRIDLVEDQAGTGAPCEDREKAGAGRGFEDQVGRSNPGSKGGQVRDRGGSRELLEFDLLLTANRVCRQIGDQLGQRSKTIVRRGGKVSFGQVHDLGEFEHVVSVAKRPATISRGTAIGLFHDPQQRVALERSIPGEGVGNRLAGGDRGFGEIEFESGG